MERYNRNNYESINDYLNESNSAYDEDEYQNNGLSFDDFEFTSVTQEKLERAEQMYISEYSMNDMYDAYVTYEKLEKINDNEIPMIDGDWAFPESGTYKGIILECVRSQKSKFDYILKILINSTEVKYVKFNNISENIVYKSLREMIPKDTEYFDTSNILGRVAILEVKNKKFHGNKVFSNILSFEVLSDEDEEILIEMIKSMLEYYDNLEQ